MKTYTLAALIILGSLNSAYAADKEITLGRFFGACEDVPAKVADASGEACIIQSVINSFSDAKNGVTVKTLPTDWGNYYDQLKAAYSGGTPPNVHVMHKHRLPEFAGVGILAEVTANDYASVGIDPNDWAQSAKDAVTLHGKMYGIPMDLHANLWHLNMDLFEQAGLLNKDGTPKLPSTPAELQAHAKLMKEKTGKDYLAADFAQFPLGVRTALALIWQQGGNIFDESGVTVDTDEARNAIKVLTDLFDANYANPKLNYAESQQAFLDGNSAVLINGTWVVDFYDAQAADANVPLNDYQIASFPTLFANGATWADSHIWTIPTAVKSDSATYKTSLQLLAWINNHNLDWARTGHMAVRTSVLEDTAYQALPHRAEYLETTKIAKDNPPSKKYGAIQDVLNRELQSIWLTGKSVDDALADAQYDIEDLQ
ncbi:extracellular solute-binding protein [Enterovibrio norvegicus]|uniref:extracellular solute-binding protein n=1 Tax=Enterovibrio norvegicus TaxID=188144 RepID=UPI00352C9A62